MDVSAVQKRIDCLTEVSLDRSCVPAARDDAGLLDREPLPGAAAARPAGVDEPCADRGVPRRPGSRPAAPFTGGRGSDAGVDGVRLDTLDALALRGVVLVDRLPAPDCEPRCRGVVDTETTSHHHHRHHHH